MEKFIVCKVTDSKYANSLLNEGEVFMQPLKKFTAQEMMKDLEKYKEELANDRVDYNECSIADYEDSNMNPLLQQMPEDFRKHIKGSTIIDQGYVTQIPVYCLYCLEIDENGFVIPDKRLAKLGDSVVIIKDFAKFFDRFLLAINKIHKKNLIYTGKINYYSPKGNKKLVPIFSKSIIYSFQNEYRIAYAKLKSSNRKDIVRQNDSIIIKLGRIDDIAFKISMNDFLKLKLPQNLNIEEITSKSSSNTIKNLTRITLNELKNYQQELVNVSIRI